MDELLRDPTILLIDGARWKTPTPPTTRDISAIGSYCIIWSPEDLQPLPADHMKNGNDWYCRGEHATIQFSRSRLVESVIIEGRFAVSTLPAEHAAAANVEGRFNALRRVVKRSYRNSVVRWCNPSLPMGSLEGRSPNCSEPDGSVWVGPGALSWLAQDASRRIKPFLGARVEGIISPLA